MVQSTRPQTLGYGLNDSPAGLAAWVLDKWRSWSERLYQIQLWTVFPRGGHFAAAEEPDLLAGDIAGFFAHLQ